MASPQTEAAEQTATELVEAPAPQLDPERIREVNVRYHDVAAESYDAKWGIDYGDIGREQVMLKLTKALGRRPDRYERSLEIGAGTGYFSLNLMRAGVIGEATATDISQGMLDKLSATAQMLDLDVETVCCDAEQLPFEDESFDLVFGHAVLHHLPGLDQAMAEFSRVLKPGGTVVFMGEPSSNGDRIAALPKRLGLLAAPLWRRAMGAEASQEAGAGDEVAEHDHSLEQFVDVHTFTPNELRSMAQRAGFEQIHVRGEELLSNIHGWAMRSLEAGTDPLSVPRAWHQFAFRSYIGLQWVDGTVLEPRLPAELFYNLLVSARKPE